MFSKIKENIEGYIETRIELVKLDVEEKMTYAIVKMVKLMIFGFASVLFLLFLSIAVAQALNTWLDSRFWGYMIVAFFYLAVLLILYFYKDNDSLYQNYFSKKKNQSL